MDSLKNISRKIKRRPSKRRIILKNGECNIIKPKFSKRYLHYVKDTFTSLVDAEWKWTFQVLCIGFTGCWLTFALLWWLIAFVHKDLHEEHLPGRQAEIGWTPCVLNVYSFSSAFLYSLETQHTTGYGSRAITEECPEAIFLMCAQCIIGMIIDSFTIGVVFAKLTRPKFTTSTVQFSQNAVITLRNGRLCLMLRIGDLRKSRLVGVSVKAFLIKARVTKEGEELHNYQTSLEIQCDESGSDIFLLWPVIVIHEINEKSPFYGLSAKIMRLQTFEIVVIFEGTIESTGQNLHAKTSYLTNEILWGYKFKNMVKFNDDMQSYEADYRYFDAIIKENFTNKMSGQEINEDNDEDRVSRKYGLQDMPYQKTCSKSTPSEYKPRNIKSLQNTVITHSQDATSTPPFPIWI